MPRVFISYRHSNAKKDAEKLYKEFGKFVKKNDVFFDEYSIRNQRDFAKEIKDSLRTSDVIVIVIGPGWIAVKEKGGSGRNRLANPADWVRREALWALRRKVPVIPVLVRGAVMPRVTELGRAIQRLAQRNAISATSRTMKDVAHLIVKQHLSGGRSAIPRKTPKPRRVRISAGSLTGDVTTTMTTTGRTTNRRRHD